MSKDLLTSLFSSPLFHTKYADMPIRANRIVQTGAKSQLGGVKPGFLSVAYHVGIEGYVNSEPRTPAIWQTTIENISLIFIGIPP